MRRDELALNPIIKILFLGVALAMLASSVVAGVLTQTQRRRVMHSKSCLSSHPARRHLAQAWVDLWALVPQV